MRFSNRLLFMFHREITNGRNSEPRNFVVVHGRHGCKRDCILWIPSTVCMGGASFTGHCCNRMRVCHALHLYSSATYWARFVMGAVRNVPCKASPHIRALSLSLSLSLSPTPCRTRPMSNWTCLHSIACAHQPPACSVRRKRIDGRPNRVCALHAIERRLS
jgi:hypothetical protein